MTQQPIWKFVDNLGDASPVDHGGYFLYHDETGVYGFEAEHLETPDDDTDFDSCKARWTVHRVCLDRCKVVIVTDDEDGSTRRYLVPYTYDSSWPHPVSSYVEWFADDLQKIADCCDNRDIEADLCSEDGARRANAYRDIASYHGWTNFDEYPLTLTRAEVKKRYAKELKAK